MSGRILRPADPRDVLAAQFEIEKEDVFHFKNLFEWMHEYLEENEWVDTDPLKDDVFEHYYWEKRMQSGLREHRAWWRVQKYPQGDSNNYWRWVMIINFRNLKAQPTQIVHHGQKVGTWRGDLTMLIEAYLQLDYNNLWRDHWLLKHFDQLYRKRIWKKNKDAWKKDLWKEAYEFSGWIKRFLDMKVPFDQPEPFHPVGGVGPNPDARR